MCSDGIAIRGSSRSYYKLFVMVSDTPTATCSVLDEHLEECSVTIGSIGDFTCSIEFFENLCGGERSRQNLRFEIRRFETRGNLEKFS